MCNFKTKHKISKKFPVLSFGRGQGEGGMLTPLFSISCILLAEPENLGGCNFESWPVTTMSHTTEWALIPSMFHAESATFLPTLLSPYNTLL